MSNIVMLDVGNMSRKNAEKTIKFVQLEQESQKALEIVDPEFAKEFSVDWETIKRLEVLYKRDERKYTNSTGAR